MDEFKYPVYYALLTVYNPVNFERIGCVVSKCFLLEEYIKHFPNGGRMEKNKVIFPIQEVDVFGNLKLNQVNFGEHTYVNSKFKSYSEAKEACFYANISCSELQHIRLNRWEEEIAEATKTLIVSADISDLNEKSL